MADTVFMDPGDTISPDPDAVELPKASSRPILESKERDSRPASRSEAGRRARRAAGASRTRRARWGIALAATLLAFAAAAWWGQHRKAPPKDDIITELASDSVPVPLPEASAPDVVASEPALAASDPAFASASAVVELPLQAVPAPATPASKPAARNASKKAQAEPAPVPVVVEVPPPPPPPPPVEVKPKPAPVRAPTPQEVCANASFFAKPMCIHQECQKPSQAGLAICVETRKRYEAEEQRARQMAN
jgi:hypothetical protein